MNKANFWADAMRVWGWWMEYDRQQALRVFPYQYQYDHPPLYYLLKMEQDADYFAYARHKYEEALGASELHLG